MTILVTNMEFRTRNGAKDYKLAKYFSKKYLFLYFPKTYINKIRIHSYINLNLE